MIQFVQITKCMCKAVFRCLKGLMDHLNSVWCVSSGDRNILQILKTNWWKYLGMAIADVEANYAVVKAYQFTTLTSIQVTKECRQ